MILEDTLSGSIIPTELVAGREGRVSIDEEISLQVQNV